MKVLLICPPSETPFKQEDHYPLGLLYLASSLEKEGFEVFVKDYYKESWKDSRDKMIEAIKKADPDVVGFTCVTMNRTSCCKMATITKRINPDIKVVMGGVHASSMYEQILMNFPVDAIVIGEGEITTPELISAFKNNKSLKKVKGIAFKDKNKVIRTEPRMPIHNLDSLPFPKHEFFKDVMKKTGTALMITSRGCPFGCIFCSTSQYWGRSWRPRSAKNVVDEIEYIIKKFPYVNRIFFHDDTFILDNQRAIDICNEILKRKIKITWECSGRIDRISKEMLLKMKEAGCTNIIYGMESGSEKILRVIDKKITKEQIKKAVDLTNEVGLTYHAYLMVGNPGETWETIKETVNFIKTLKNLEVNSVGRLEIYPNSPVYALAKEQGVVDDSYWLTEKKVPHYTYEHSEEELTQMAYYIVARNQLQRGLLNFIVFALKFFFDKPKKAIRYILIKLRLMK